MPLLLRKKTLYIVIPANAGIQTPNSEKSQDLDSRVRGNDNRYHLAIINFPDTEAPTSASRARK